MTLPFFLKYQSLYVYADMSGATAYYHSNNGCRLGVSFDNLKKDVKRLSLELLGALVTGQFTYRYSLLFDSI